MGIVVLVTRQGVSREARRGSAKDAEGATGSIDEIKSLDLMTQRKRVKIGRLEKSLKPVGFPLRPLRSFAP